MNYSGTPLMRTPTGRQKVSLLERCPQFRGVLIEGFHCNHSPLGPVVLRVVCCSPPCVQLVSEWSVCEVCLSKHSPVMFTQQQGKVQQIYIRSSVQNNNVQHVTQTHSPSRLYTNQLSYHNCPISKASRIPHITGCLRQLLTSNPYQHKSTAYYYQGQTACCHLGHQDLLSLPLTAGNMRYSQIQQDHY